ncbi:putative alpha-ketoglutarate-dependent dioxygenase AlkB-like superfamily [Helianthus annuus]|nr:putative alpha-ketoglutarate-dependent dioxygenase AlkB-like superfamily [Helianthus annuus]
MCQIEPIPAPLEDVIDHVIQFHLISENKRPNSCIISFFDEEFSQPFLKPPHLEQPISTLLLSVSTMAFGRTSVCNDDGNYKGPLMLSLTLCSRVSLNERKEKIWKEIIFSCVPEFH